MNLWTLSLQAMLMTNNIGLFKYLMHYVSRIVSESRQRPSMFIADQYLYYAKFFRGSTGHEVLNW